MRRQLILMAALIALSGCDYMKLAAIKMRSDGEVQAIPAPTEQAPVVAAADVERLQQAAIEVLFWNQEKRDANFRQMERLFPGTIAPPAARPRVLPAGEPLAITEAEVAAYMEDQHAAGILVLQDGRIRYERYGLGMRPQDRWTSFSMAKSLTATLAGVAIKQGAIASLDDPVTRYVPELAGSGYDGVSVRQVLTMTSGVKWDENYASPSSDVARMYTDPVQPGVDPMVSYLKRLPSEAAPGSKWVYKTGETNLVGIIVQRATGKLLTKLASETIIPAIGFEGTLFWQVDTVGQNIGGCCLSLTMRDYARLGQFALEGGNDALPQGWMAEATGAQVPFGNSGNGYGYQWWHYPRGYGARGIFGQSITILPEKRAVVVLLSAWPRATDGEISNKRSAWLERLRAAL